MSLDGFFEGNTPWDLWFHQTIWGDEVEAQSIRQLQEMDLLLFGRKTYEGMASYWATEEGTVAELMNAVPKLVASKTLAEARWQNTTIVSNDIAAALRDLKQRPGKDIYVFGSAQLLETLFGERLVDEYRVCLAPVIAGGGNPLFKPSATALRLDLLEATPLQTGGVILRYGIHYPD